MGRTITSRKAKCRACDSTDLLTWFSLGEQPLANAFTTEPTEHDRYPLAVQRCQRCWLSQLTHVVNPDLLYSQYAYQSGVSRGWHVHCQGIVAIIQEHLPEAEFVIDVASNDGTLLQYLGNAGYRAVGVDPARNLAALGRGRVHATYWTEQSAREIVQMDGQADVIVAQNVLGHVDDVVGFLRGVKHALAPDGVLLVEVPTLDTLLRDNAFDTIYHEHLSYWSILPMRYACARAGLAVTRVDRITLHGGSYRIWIRHGGAPEQSVMDELKSERNLSLGTHAPYARFNARVDVALRRLGEILETISHKRFVAYGAAAKGTVLLNELARRGIPLPSVVYDDATAKQGTYIPGVNIRVEPPSCLKKAELLLILPWNWAKEIQARARDLDFAGQAMVALPSPRFL